MGKTYAINYKRELTNDKAVNNAIGVFFFILAMAFGAYARIPVPGTPVPITLQTLFVMLSGAVLGRRFGSFSQFGYIALGAMGIPIFQGYSFGFAHILGPTGGYLIGFIFAAYVIGYLFDSRDFSIAGTVTAFVIGSFILYGFGVLWLMFLYKLNIIEVMSIGVLPFIPGEVIKISFAILIYSVISKRSKNIFSS